MHVYKDLYQNWFKLFHNGIKPPLTYHLDPDWLTTVFYAHHDADDQAIGDPMYFTRVDEYVRNVVTPHRIAVYEEGIKLYSSLVFFDGKLKNWVSIEEFMVQLYVHDLSKYSAQELVGYAFYDFKQPAFDFDAPATMRQTGNGVEATKALQSAWGHHQQVNAHHPEHWCNSMGKPFPMPKKYILEMLADWLGASRTYGTPFNEWINSEKGISKFSFHRETAKRLTYYLGLMGVNTAVLNINTTP